MNLKFRCSVQKEESLVGMTLSSHKQTWTLSLIYILMRCEQKIFYDRETRSATFCAIQWMSFNPPSILCNSTLFLNQWSQPIIINGRDFSQLWNPHTPYCSSRVESLLCELYSYQINHLHAGSRNSLKERGALSRNYILVLNENVDVFEN